MLTALGFGYHSALVRQLDVARDEGLEEKARALHGYLQFENGTPVLALRRGRSRGSGVHRRRDAATTRSTTPTRGRLLAQSPGMESLGLHYTPAEVAEFRAQSEPRDVQTDRGRLRAVQLPSWPRGRARRIVVQVGEPARSRRQDAGRLRPAAAVETSSEAADAPPLPGAGWRAGPCRLCRDWRPPRSAIGITQPARTPAGARRRTTSSTRWPNAFNHALGARRAVGRRDAAVQRGARARTADAARDPPWRGGARARPSAVGRRARQERLASQIDEYDRLTRLINQILTLATGRGRRDRAGSRRWPSISRRSSAVAEQIEPVASARGIVLTCDVDLRRHRRGRCGLAGAAAADPARQRDQVHAAKAAASRCACRVSTGMAHMSTSPTAGSASRRRRFRVCSSGSIGPNRPARGRPPGAGLGLALAKWIAERHEATDRRHEHAWRRQHVHREPPRGRGEVTRERERRGRLTCRPSDGVWLFWRCARRWRTASRCGTAHRNHQHSRAPGVASDLRVTRRRSRDRVQRRRRLDSSRTAHRRSARGQRLLRGRGWTSGRTSPASRPARRRLRPEDEPGDYKLLADFAARGIVSEADSRWCIGGRGSLGACGNRAADAAIGRWRRRAGIAEHHRAGVAMEGRVDLRDARHAERAIVQYRRRRRTHAGTRLSRPSIRHTTSSCRSRRSRRSSLLRTSPRGCGSIEASDHRFSDNLAELDRRLLDAMAWVRASTARIEVFVDERLRQAIPVAIGLTTVCRGARGAAGRAARRFVAPADGRHHPRRPRRASSSR